MFRTVGLIGKQGDARAELTLGRLVAFLEKRGVALAFDAESARGLPTFGVPVVERDELGRRCDLVIVVAGDGTFLGAARSMVDHGVPLVGINQGRLGFLADIMPEEMETRLEEILAGDFDQEQRFLLQVKVLRDHDAPFEMHVLNEVVAHKWNIARLLNFETWIDGRLVSSQRSDGLIVATPTGSTAYALSGGGPILHADLDAVVLVPICPHTLSSRPLVVSAGSTIEVRIGAASQAEAQLTGDGQKMLELGPGDRVIIRRKEPPLCLIHPRDYDYFATLRAKLHWSKEL
jgi:NAD+ kinase